MGIHSNPSPGVQRVDYPSAALDAFARLRVSNPTTLFDSKQLESNQPLFWDDAQTAGSGTATARHRRPAPCPRSAKACPPAAPLPASF